MLAILVKARLERNILRQCLIWAGDYVVLSEPLLIFDGESCIVVGAAHKNELFSRMPTGKLLESIQHYLGIVNIRHCAELHYAAVLGISDLISAEGIAAHTVRLVKGTGNIVAVEVCAEQNGSYLHSAKLGLNISFCHMIASL